MINFGHLEKKIVIIQALNMLFAELKDCQLEEI